MIHTDAQQTNVKLWLAPPGAQCDAAPGVGGDRPEVDARSLRVLIVEDEFFISLHTKGLLHAMGHMAVAVAVSADQAVAIAERERPDVVLMDIRLLTRIARWHRCRRRDQSSSRHRQHFCHSEYGSADPTPR